MTSVARQTVRSNSRVRTAGLPASASAIKERKSGTPAPPPVSPAPDPVPVDEDSSSSPEKAKEPKVGKVKKKAIRSDVTKSLVRDINLDAWQVKERPALREDGASKTPGNTADERTTEEASRLLRERLRELQNRLIASSSKSILIVLQAMDAGGKDGTVKSLYGGLNPSAAAVFSFSVPSEEELAHDFLWRIHARTPGKGNITIFNRSHYEDVLAVRVRKIAPPAVWRPRFEQIRNFESTLNASGTKVVKIMLHISNIEQRKRLQARIDRPDKRWKFRMGDLEDRALWTEYKRAYQDAIAETSTPDAPWFVVPADKKWYRDYAVLCILVSTLEHMNLEYPEFSNLDGLQIP